MAQTPLILGLNSMHPDSAAVLVGPQGIIAAIAEERINRKKHCATYPREAIREVLKIAGASISDITDVAVARDPKANLNAKLKFMAQRPLVGLNLARIRLSAQSKASQSQKQVAEEGGFDRSLLKARQHNVEHHLAHIASSFYTSGYQRATGISIDGMGDWCCAMTALCEGSEIKVLRRCHPPHSLGVFYSGVCGFIGFNKFGEEYKVMGLAAYGRNAYPEKFAEMFRFDPEKGFQLNQAWFTAFTRVESKEEGLFDTSGRTPEILMPDLFSEKFIEAFGEPRRRGQPLTQRDHDIAASLQARFEEIYLDLIKDTVARTGVRDVVMAGGCALNGVANGKAVMQKLVDKMYIHSAASDDGTAVGAALYVLHNVHGVPRLPAVKSAYFGPEASETECATAVAAASAAQGLTFRKLSREELLATAVDALSRGKIMGWFQGREEWGPRALGNRSIICNPSWPNMKAILNARIKNREPFRPFAPVIMLEHLNDVYEGSHEVPFMNIVFKTRPEWREKLSAVNHEDNTGRVQSVSREQNALYYDLLKAFHQRTGVPVLLNTSFNENEPIVHTPEQAISCFARTRMDCLAVGPFWCEKPAELAEKAQVISAEA